MASILYETVNETTGLRIRQYDREGFVPAGAKPTFWAADFVNGNALDSGTGDTAQDAVAKLLRNVGWKDAA